MVGICGVLGDGSLPHDVGEWITHREDERRFAFEDDGFSFAASVHDVLAGDQPAEAADGDVLVWVWGDVYGYDTGEGHVPRRNGRDGSAEFCASLYDALGLDFVSGLNGDYALVVYDRAEKSVSFVTDRFATRPIFYYRPDEETVLFASALQGLAAHPEVPVDIDLSYLYEYFQLRRVFGVKTPLSGVEELLPATVTTVDLESGAMDAETYWRPHYEPVDRSFESFRDDLVDTLSTVLDEWTDDDLDYGLLLSGGSDSRLVQAALDRPVTAFHNADFMSREARVARRAATVSGDEFHLLKRDSDYDARLLEEAPRLSNFSGWFDQAYFSGFEDQITSEADALVSGLYADMLFAGNPLATRGFSLGGLGTVTLPARRNIDSIDDYVAFQTKAAERSLPYVDIDRSLTDVMRENIHHDGDEIVSHGVRYRSLTDLVMYGDFYPMGGDTDAIFSRTLMQMLPYRTPFLDNRLIDLASEIPVKYLLRRKLVDSAVEALDADLASIPHARTGIPLKYPFPISYLGDNLYGFWRKHVDEDETPAPHLSHDPWPNRRELLRTLPFAADTLEARADLAADLPFLDYDGARTLYDDHLGGEDHQPALYSLLTFLNMPVAAQARASELSDTSPQSHGVAVDGGRTGSKGGGPQ